MFEASMKKQCVLPGVLCTAVVVGAHAGVGQIMYRVW
jgi:hypothetical protein